MKAMKVRRFVPLLVCGLMLVPSAVGPQAPGADPGVLGQVSTLLSDGRALLSGGQRTGGPVDTLVVVDSRTGATSLSSLQHPRAWHTATVLPDGTVLILGGLGINGRALADPEIFDPESQRLATAVIPGLSARARHSTTLLTDGRLLIAGGRDDAGQTSAKTELWNPRTGHVEVVPLSTARAGHTATVEADGSVLLWGGTGAFGPLTNGDRFDPTLSSFTATDTRLVTAPGGESPSLAGSIPAAGATDVPVQSVVAVRFSNQLRVETVNAGTVMLTSPHGPEPVRVVAVEQGMLVFVTPETDLMPGTRYTLSVNGAEDSEGTLLPLTEMRFTTTGPAPVTDGSTAGQSGSLHHHHPAGTADPPGTVSESDPYEWTGELRNGKPHSRWQDLSPLQAPAGTTALAGQVLRLNGEPLANVTLEIGPRTARTDSSGRFLLTDIDSGPQELEMDGSTANRPGRTYGTFSYGISITASQTNVLPFTIWMPLLDMRHATPIPVPTAREVVATSPLIPGLEVHIPADVVLRTYDHGPLTTLSLTRIPVDRPPFPLPPGTTFFFTPQGHGAHVERPDGTESPRGVRMILPNPDHLPARSRVELWSYDYEHGGWYTYGRGTVSEDGRQIVPDAGVEFKRLTCTFPLGPLLTAIGAVLGGIRAGDPVDLATGLFTMEKTDLALPDVIPIVIKREYWQTWSQPGTFGFNQSFLYQMFLTGDTTTYSLVELVLPGGSKVRFPRINAGADKESAVFEHTATPTAYFKARITWNSARNGWDLTLKDQTVYQFASLGNPGPMLVGIRDRAGNQLTVSPRTLTFHLQDFARITSPSGRWVELTWQVYGTDRITQVRDNLGRTVTYTYGTGTLLTRVTDPAGGTTEYTYDGSSQRIKTIKDARGIVYLTNDYDANGRVIKQTQADGTFYQFAYTVDGSGKVTQTDVTDPRGNVRRVTFNGAGYPLTDTRAFGTALAQTTTYVRDATSNLVTSMTDALGRRTDYTYDTMGNVLTVTRLAGTADAVTSTLTYEPTFNQVSTVTDPLNHTTTLGYDAVGNVTSITDALNHQTTLTYNAAGQPLTVTTPAGTTQLAYDQGDLATITDATGKTTTRFTDGAGRLISLTNPLGQRTRYDYDLLNQLTKITDPLDGMTQLSYDGNGNLLNLTDARTSVTSYVYDTMDRVTTRTDPLLHPETSTYDNNGNPANWTDRKSQVTQTSYDALDRPTQVTYQDGSITNYTWDPGNRLTQLVDSLSGTITRAYDGLDRLTQEVTPQGTVSYTYDAGGRRASMTVLGQPAVSYSYDNADRLIQITQDTATVAFAYDSANRRTSLTLPNGVVTEYAYDAASRLTGLTYRSGGSLLGTLTYTYDANGNRTVVGGTWAATGLPQPVTSTTYDAANRQLTFGGLTLSYDLNGNLTGDSTNTYTWDARNRLVAITGASGPASFSYDGFGRRQGKTIDATATQFLYDGLNPIQELTGTTPVASLLTGLGVDEYFTRTDATGDSYFLADALGSTVALTDATSSVPTTYTYEPFGATTISGSAAGNSFDYTGREEDGTGLKYYRARYYHPGLQRFISEDPIGFRAGDPNLYAYVGNNPLSFRDPTGDIAIAAPVVIGGAVIVALWLASPQGQQAVRDTVEAATDLAGTTTQAMTDLWVAISSTLKGDDPGYGSDDERRKAIEEAQKVLRDPNATQRDKSKAKRRIEELSRRRSKRAHGGDKLIAGDPSLDTISTQLPPRFGCRKACE